MMMMRRLVIPILAGSLLSTGVNAQNRSSTPDHSEWIMDPNLWGQSMKDFARTQPEMRLRFLSATQQGLRSATRGQLFGVGTGEVVIRGKEQGGAIERVTISIFNRGDDRMIPVQELNSRFEKLAGILTEKTGAEPVDRSEAKAVNLKSLMWSTEASAYLLEKSISGNASEFLRLRLAPLKAARQDERTANRRHLSMNIVRDLNRDVWIKNIPMVDQGRKGYCACATAARVYQYYGLETTQHEIAQIAKAGPQTGTSPSLMVEALQKVTTKMDSRVLIVYEYPRGVADPDARRNEYLAGMREVKNDFNKYQSLAMSKGKGVLTIGGKKGGKIPRDYSISISRARLMMDPEIYREVMVKKSNFSRFQSQIRKYINEGVPLAWGLQLGMFPEKGLPQATGGHMRLIIGYNDRTKEVIYSDSWGAGHEKKRMPIADAFCMSSLLLALPPLH